MARNILIASLASLLLTVLIFPASAAAKASKSKSASARVLWQGDSEGFKISWTSKDLTVSREGVKIYSALADMRRAVDILRDGYPGIYAEQHVRLLSVVGPYLSIEYHCFYVLHDETGAMDGAHPLGFTRFRAIDMRHPENSICTIFEMGGGPDLQKVLDAKSLVDALNHETIFASSIGEVSSIDEIQTMLAKSPSLEPPDDWKGTPLCGMFDSLFLNAFAFHHLERGKVAVHLGVSGAGTCRENLTELAILLPVPAKMEKQFQQAAIGAHGGVLMQQLRSIKGITTYTAFVGPRKKR